MPSCGLIVDQIWQNEKPFILFAKSTVERDVLADLPPNLDIGAPREDLLFLEADEVATIAQDAADLVDAEAAKGGIDFKRFGI